MLHATACPTHSDANPLTLTQLRQVRDENHTRRVDNLIVDKRTGEIVGCYMHSQFIPEPYSCLPAPKKMATNRPGFVMTHDGSSIPINAGTEALPRGSADIIQFPVQAVSARSNAGRPPAVLNNPFAIFLQYVKLHDVLTPWLENYIVGACGVQVEQEGGAHPTEGRFNVAPSDVRIVLHLPEISTATASTSLCNHNVEPMGVRQVERVVQAARIALGGLMHHLERHPGLMEQFEYTVDFEAFWKDRSAQVRGESACKAEALEMFRQDHTVTVAAVAKQFGVHRNTVSKWKREAAMHN